MTLNEALILSYVKRGIGYGYNILKHVKKTRSDEWVDFSRAGLYKTLDKLERRGLVEKTLERDGNRPPRKVYRITPSGESALSGFLEDGFDFDFPARNEFDAYLVTAVAASPDSRYLAGKVRARREAVENRIDELKNGWPEDKGRYPFIVYALYRRRMEVLEQELQWLVWLEELLTNVEGDILHMTWSQASE